MSVEGIDAQRLREVRENAQEAARAEYFDSRPAKCPYPSWTKEAEEWKKAFDLESRIC
ncbi:hypothetical protein [Paraburkholderia lycopersici]|uniref:Uncharacterized protein n=1 Tax=Paraburkholderia lycopersici TaxID=416944 RepID=A0A1G7CRC2_9BURK|nr:hypothetical protein [Paraburkholderia lycopersici]SDE41055.1 hypothetical protein SAMN05421548_1474 [Paraburkholderia lycopersici]